MNGTATTEKITMQKPENAPSNGGQKPAQSKRPCNSNGSKTGRPESEKYWITRQEACAVLECHVQTLDCRERKGEITGWKIGRQKWYSLEDVEKMMEENPVASRPYKPRKRRKKAVAIPPKPPSLWERFKALFL